SLNLIPIGQLDGGHVAYALWGRRQRTIALAIVPTLIVLGFFGWPGWFLWAGMASMLGVGHPPVLDPEAALGRTRIWVGWGALAMRSRLRLLREAWTLGIIAGLWLVQPLGAAERFTLVLDGAGVQDAKTGLIWEQTPDLEHDVWSRSVARCATKTLGGKTGWR